MSTSCNKLGIAVSGMTDGNSTHALFLKPDGTVYSCGLNNYGQLGTGGTTNSNIPINISGLDDIIQVSAGGWHSLFLKSDGTVYSCGNNDNGQLGLGDTVNRTTPQLIPNLSEIVSIGTGSHNSYFIKLDGTCYACGYGGCYQLATGNNSNQTSPVKCNIDNVQAVTADNKQAYFIKKDGTLWRCSNYTSYNSSPAGGVTVPTKMNLENVVYADCAGDDASGAWFVTEDGSVYSYGNAFSWSSFSSQNLAKLNISNVIAVSICNGSGDDQKHTLFLKADGTVYYVGVINSYSVGNLATTSTPTIIPNLSNVKGIQAGSDSSYFILEDGTVKVVGYNNNGELGIGNSSTISSITTNSNIKVLFSRKNSDFTFLAQSEINLFYVSEGVTESVLLKTKKNLSKNLQELLIEEPLIYDSTKNLKLSKIGTPLRVSENVKFDYGIKLEGNSYLISENSISLGGNDLTIDYWIYEIYDSKFHPHFELINSSENKITIYKEWDTGYSITTNSARSSFTDLINEKVLSHIAITYIHSSGKWNVFVNGINKYSATSSLTKSDFILKLGNTIYGSSWYPNETISEFRISNIARWTSNFTPPSEKYSVDNNTLVLLHF